MAKRRRDTVAFGMSFLDAMTCGLGAVVLLYMIINASVALRSNDAREDLTDEATTLEADILESHQSLVDLRARLRRVDRREDAAQAVSTRLLENLEAIREELAVDEESTLARRESLEKLKTDLKNLEEDTRRLSASIPDGEDRGERVRAFAGDGTRQYLTGLKVGGRRILLLVDTSASMLGENVVNVLVRRNLPPERKIRAEKWQRAVHTVDWLTTQLPQDSTFQIYTFNEETKPLLPDTGGQWLPADDALKLEEAVMRLEEIVPDGGTNLTLAFGAIRTLGPLPDNVILLTDGLPTMGRGGSRSGKVSGKKRLQLFEEAVRAIPSQTPINTILFPMEGDPMAASAFWKLAIASQGSFMSPSKDWP